MVELTDRKVLATAAALALVAAGCGGASRTQRTDAGKLAVQKIRRHPELEATVTGAFVHKKPRWGPAKVTVTFTLTEGGRPAGPDIPFGSYFLMLLRAKDGRLGGPPMVRAYGANGHYSATTTLPPGGIGSVTIGGWLSIPTGSPTAKGGFWIPVTVADKGY